jgi:hypothetical protein
MVEKDFLHWSQLDVKSKIAYITAVVAFVIGWGLTVAGFIIGAGVISDSVLWVLGQALVYAASVFGVGMYVGSEVIGMRRSIRRFMKEEKEYLENNYQPTDEVGEEE